MGHARALVTLNDPVAQLSLYNLILEEGLSVRKVESIVREFAEGKPIQYPAASPHKKTNRKRKKRNNCYRTILMH